MDDNSLHNERDLLVEVADGNERAFYVLYRHFYLRLKPVVVKYIGSETDAQEILQATFLKVWLHRDQLPEIENFRSWIYKVAYREYLGYLRKKMRYEARVGSYVNAQPAGSDVMLPQDNISLEDIRKTVQEAVAALSPQRRLIFELSRNEGLQVGEIAAQLSLSPQTVKNVLQIAQKLIREHLTASGYGSLPLVIFFPFFY